MASEPEHFLDNQSFPSGYLRQPHWSPISSRLVEGSEQPLDTAFQDLQLASLFSTGPVDQNIYNTAPFVQNTGSESSPWTQIPIACPQSDQSSFESDISMALQTSQQSELPNSSSSHAGGLPCIPEHTTMNAVPYLHQLTNTIIDGQQSALQSGSSFPRDFQPLFTSMSPSSGCASMGGGTPSPHTVGSEVAPHTNFNATFSSNGLAPLDFEEEDLNSEPYAKLIFRALKSAPGHRMVLREIYEWFEINTDKAGDPKSRGWQNSIRHNLSMNGAFRKEEQLAPSEDGRRNFVWVLEKAAIEAGEVQSTTRYRRPGANKRVTKSDAGFHRQRCGAKGGRSSKGRQQRDRSSQSDLNHPFFRQTGSSSNGVDAEMQTRAEEGYKVGCYVEPFTGIEHGLPRNLQLFSTPSATRGRASRHSPLGHDALVPQISPTPTLTSASHTEPETYDLEQIVGCTDYDGTPLFSFEQLEDEGPIFCESEWQGYSAVGPSGPGSFEELSLRS